MTTHQVRLIDAAAIPTIVVQRRAPQGQLGQVVPAACGTVWQFIREHGVKAGRNVALYLSGAVDVEAGAEALGGFTPLGEIKRSQLPAGRVATTTHFGPYSGLGAAHHAVLEWCQRQGHALAVPSWEIYGHWQESWNSDPSKIETQVCYLLA